MAENVAELQDGKGNGTSRDDNVDIENHLLFEVCNEVGCRSMLSVVLLSECPATTLIDRSANIMPNSRRHSDESAYNNT